MDGTPKPVPFGLKDPGLNGAGEGLFAGVAAGGALNVERTGDAVGNIDGGTGEVPKRPEPDGEGLAGKGVDGVDGLLKNPEVAGAGRVALAKGFSESPKMLGGGGVLVAGVAGVGGVVAGFPNKENGGGAVGVVEGDIAGFGAGVAGIELGFPNPKTESGGVLDLAGLVPGAPALSSSFNGASVGMGNTE